MKRFLLPITFLMLLVACGTTKKVKETAPAEPKISTTTNKPIVINTGNTNPDAIVIATNVAPGIEKEILVLINNYRKSKGLPALADLPIMTREARKHSVNMASGKVKFGHFGFDSRKDQVVAQNAKITSFAENVAFGSKTAEEVVKGWIASPGHKKNIEGNYTYSGIGVARNAKNQLYFTQLFAK